MSRYYYERDDGEVIAYPGIIKGPMPMGRLVRRVYLVPTDPAEVVAELRAEADGIEKRSQNTYTRDMIMALTYAADLVAEKLGVVE